MPFSLFRFFWIQFENILELNWEIGRIAMATIRPLYSHDIVAVSLALLFFQFPVELIAIHAAIYFTLTPNIVSEKVRSEQVKHNRFNINITILH